jgi:site-specific recombinase XerD
MARKRTPPPIPLSDLLQSWTQVLKAQNKARSTVYNYTAHVAGYIKWCEQRGETPRIDRELATDWIAELLAGELEASTVKARQLALRGFSAWMSEIDDIPYTDQLVGMKPPRQSEKLITPLSDVQLRIMFAACEGKSLRDKRDEAVLRLMADTGMRVGEVIAMHVADVDTSAGTVTIRKAKAGHGRVVSFWPKTAVAIDTYLRVRRHHVLAHHPQMWLGERNHGLAYVGLRSSILERAELAGIKGFHPHLLRHTAASRWLDAGGSEQGLMQRAGWSSRQMLDRYTRASAEARATAEAKRLNLGL